MPGESLNLRMDNDIGRDGDVVREKPIGGSKGNLGAQRIMSSLQ